MIITEQLLLAKSVERAIARLELPDVGGMRAFVELSAIPRRYGGYLKSLLATRLGPKWRADRVPKGADLPS
jgi:hypothetical protein